MLSIQYQKVAHLGKSVLLRFVEIRNGKFSETHFWRTCQKNL